MSLIERQMINAVIVYMESGTKVDWPLATTQELTSTEDSVPDM
jgi:hypothetical protein